MIALAVLLLVIVAAIVLFVVITGTSETVRLDWEQLNIAWEASALVVFLLGAVSLLLVGLALGMFQRGTKRGIERRRELKRLREQDAERARAERVHAEQDRADRARAVPPVAYHDRDEGVSREAAGTQRVERTEERPVSPPAARDDEAGRSRSDASGATRGDSSWYDDTPPERR